MVFKNVFQTLSYGLFVFRLSDGQKVDFVDVDKPVFVLLLL